MQGSYGFVQTPCPKCGTTVWISPQAGMGYCPGCQSQVPMPPGGNAVAAASAPQAQYGQQAGAYGQQPGAPYGQQPGAAPYGQQAAPNANANAAAPYAVNPAFRGVGAGAKPPSRVAIIGGAVLVVLGGLALGGVRAYLAMSKGNASAKSIGVDPKSAELTKMIEGTRSLARKWRSDAEFYSINVAGGINKDGTVDLNSGTVTVTWYSPSRVTSSSNATRKDSVKKFVFNGDKVTYAAMWGATKPWKGVKPTPVPACDSKQLAKAMKADDVSLGSGATLSINPNWGNAWHVASGSDSKWYDLDDCSPLKLKMGGEDDGTGSDE